MFSVLFLGMSVLERKKDVFQELREKFLKTYLVCIYFCHFRYYNLRRELCCNDVLL